MKKIIKRSILPCLISLLLWVIWPGIAIDRMVAQAKLAGVIPDTIALYQSALPDTLLPTPVLLWLTIFIGFNCLIRLFSAEAKYQKYQADILGLGAIWGLLGLLQWIFGAPFFTGDSLVYMRWIQEPSTLFGAHHPSGTSWILWLGKLLRLPISATFTAIGALELVLLRQLLSGVVRPLVSWLAVAFFLLYPDFLVMRLSIWSEPGIILAMVMMLVLLQSKLLSKYLKFVILCLIFVAMSEMRHAAIFLLPALAIATGLAITSGHKLHVKLLGIALASGSLLAAWMLLNYNRTGRAFDPTTSSFECAQFITAYHGVPFCSTAPDIPLCQKIGTGSELNQALGLRPDFIALDRFIFRPESPLNQLNLTPEGYCNVWSLIQVELIKNYKIELAQLLFYRIVSQFGNFEISERGANLRPEGVTNSLSFLDHLLASSNLYLWPVWLFWLFALVKSWKSPRLYDPVVIFCLVGALGHAAGIALSNPFLGLRYLAIAKYLVSIAAARLILVKKQG
jgi:hypothetical protein